VSTDRLLDLLALLALGCVAVVGLGHVVAQAARRVWVLPIDRERRPAEAVADLGFLLGMAVWLYEAVAQVASPAHRIGWGPLPLEIPGTGLRWLGLAVAVAAVALYVLALRDMGASWRFTIDRERPGELVTSGVFAHSRNPIYLALTLLAAGVGLVLANALLLLLAGGAALYFEHLVRREEGFLAERYGDAYAAYCARTPRWLRRSRPGGP
jgi:protein-S-isoprenylcysteine O-methyltransferase Ste14